MKKLRFGIFGCGVIAKPHATVLKEIENAELYACADISEKAALSFAETYSIKSFSSLDEMLESGDVDIICVCTPSGTHADIAIKILEADKNVILEKPMAIKTVDCDSSKKIKGKAYRYLADAFGSRHQKTQISY